MQFFSFFFHYHRFSPKFLLKSVFHKKAIKKIDFFFIIKQQITLKEKKAIRCNFCLYCSLLNQILSFILYSLIPRIGFNVFTCRSFAQFTRRNTEWIMEGANTELFITFAVSCAIARENPVLHFVYTNWMGKVYGCARYNYAWF